MGIYSKTGKFMGVYNKTTSERAEVSMERISIGYSPVCSEETYARYKSWNSESIARGESHRRLCKDLYMSVLCV